MCYIRIILIAAIALAAFSQLRAELPAPLISVDTVFKIQTNGSKGAVFLPEGNSVIMMCNDTPYLIDAKTWTVIRQFEYKAGEETEVPIVSKEGKYLFARTNSGLAVWNIQTGKIIKYLRNCVDYCLSQDGTKLYQTIINDKNNTGVIRVYDMNTLEEIEVFCSHNFWGGEEIAISPDGKTLALTVSHDPIGYEGDNINRSVILIDLNKKNEFVRIESITPWITDMQFSPNGNNLIYLHKDGSNYMNIYNLLTKRIIQIKEDDLEALVGYQSLLSGYPNFLDENTISYVFSKYLFIWKFNDNKAKKLIKFLARTISINNNNLLLSDYYGNLALLNLSEVSVGEVNNRINNALVFSNNQLEFFSDKSFVGESMIYDTTGKQIANLGSQSFISGKNIIRVNQPLPLGAYLITIKNDINQFSYKFIVE